MCLAVHFRAVSDHQDGESAASIRLLTPLDTPARLYGSTIPVDIIVPLLEAKSCLLCERRIDD
jgi:hypothetical protein